jgi:hypothetical protein
MRVTVALWSASDQALSRLRSDCPPYPLLGYRSDHSSLYLDACPVAEDSACPRSRRVGAADHQYERRNGISQSEAYAAEAAAASRRGWRERERDLCFGLCACDAGVETAKGIEPLPAAVALGVLAIEDCLEFERQIDVGVFVVPAMRPTLPPGQAARRGHPAGERSPGDNCCKIAIAPRIKCSKTSFANLRHARKFESRLLGPTNLSSIVAGEPTSPAVGE